MSTQEKYGIGINQNRQSPNKPYLMFVDNCIIFLGPITRSERNVKHMLDHYYRVYG